MSKDKIIIKPANPVEETRGRTVTPLQVPKPVQQPTHTPKPETAKK
jgi:hypothetical protein